MYSLVEAAWPSKADGVCYQNNPLTDHARFKILEISLTQDGSDPKVDITKKTFEDLPHYSESSRQCCLHLVVITRSWRPNHASHEKLPHYNISKEDFTKILEMQGLTRFFTQTRAEVAGLFSLPTSYLSQTDTYHGEYFALIYDAYLGFWASYNSEQRQWQGICILAETSLDFKFVAEEIVHCVQNKKFLYLLVVKYTMDFIRLKSGELPTELGKIESYSGHHDSRLQPIPATYKSLKATSASATATANLVSYHKSVMIPLTNELLQFIEESCGKDSSQTDSVNQQVTYLRQRLKSLSAYLRYLERRAERQVAATFHIVTQANASINLAVARDTKTIAIASKHDSSSMKMLAAVTTIFVPGAFIASLFSMNMFNWFATDDTPVMSGRLWIYWSITIPLTLISVCIWLGWEFWFLRQQKKLPQSSDAEDDETEKRTC